jgi:TPR repeat protein
MRKYLILSLFLGGILSVGGFTAYQFLTPHSFSEEEFTAGLGLFEKKQYEDAFNHWHPMAKAGHGRAQINIGQMYRTGAGVEKNREQAQHWLTKAATAGMPRAQFALAETYGKVETPTESDQEAAAKWYKRAADQGLVDAIFWLAVANFNGHGTEKNYSAAYRLMLIASRHGHKKAKQLLAQVQSKIEISERMAVELDAAKWIPKPEKS